MKWSIQALPLQSLVLVPEEGERVRASQDGRVGVRGIAYSGYTGAKIVRVEVSTNGGAGWEEARLREEERAATPLRRARSRPAGPWTC